MSEPVPVRVLKLLEKTSGRDRVCRLAQYSAKLVGWLLEDDHSYNGTVAKMKTLESSISIARKLFRIGRSLDQLKTALQTLHLANPVHRLLITLSKINRGLYLLMDHVVWAAKLKLLNVDTARWSKIAYRFWALAIFFGLLRDIYDFVVALREQAVKRPLTVAVSRTVSSHPALILDLVKNSTDMVLPLNGLQVLHQSAGVVGLMGMTSSLCGLVTLWNEPLKLRYS